MLKLFRAALEVYRRWAVKSKRKILGQNLCWPIVSPTAGVGEFRQGLTRRMNLFHTGPDYTRNNLSAQSTFANTRDLGLVARGLPCNLNMNRTCQYCREEIAGSAYHVTSESEGVILLDMIVCAACAAVAEGLELRTQKITPEWPESSVPHQRYLI